MIALAVAINLTIVPIQQSAPPLDYASSVRCHSVLAYFSDQLGDTAHEAIRNGASNLRSTFVFQYGAVQGVQPNRVEADLAAAYAAVKSAMEVEDDAVYEANGAAMGREINTCLARLSASW